MTGIGAISNTGFADTQYTKNYDYDNDSFKKVADEDKIKANFNGLMSFLSSGAAKKNEIEKPRPTKTVIIKDNLNPDSAKKLANKLVNIIPKEAKAASAIQANFTGEMAANLLLAPL